MGGEARGRGGRGLGGAGGGVRISSSMRPAALAHPQVDVGAERGASWRTGQARLARVAVRGMWSRSPLFRRGS
jgi:hypothetical protein